MRNTISYLVLIVISFSVTECRSTKKLHSAINKKDTTVIASSANVKDSAQEYKSLIRKNNMDFVTFSAKIKVQYEDVHGKQPDVNAFVRMYKDSVIWASINATFLNIEAFRVLITKDSVFIVDKLDKTVSFHSISYLQDIAHIPLDLHTLQQLIIGNPVFVGDKVLSYKRTENRVLISTAGEFFKNLVTLKADNNLLLREKLDDLDVMQNRTADLSYAEYQDMTTFLFPTYREITIAERTKVDVVLNFKQFEFNKQLTYPFTVPKNYKVK
jgi:hypothetical protein